MFDKLRMLGLCQVVRNIACQTGGHRDLALKVRVRPSTYCLRVVKNLSYHFSAGLRIAPELAFDERQPAELIDEGDVQRASFRPEFGAERDQRAVGGIDFLDWQQPRIVEQHVPE